MPSIFRARTHEALRGLPLAGRVVDLGGERGDPYHALFSGTFAIETVNLNPKTNPDVLADLEAPLPFADETYTGAILMNVLEHVLEAQQLVRETYRVLKPEGVVYAVVPFLFPIHPCPKDFHRFTSDALVHLFARGGFRSVKVTVIGGGVFTVRHLLLARLYPRFIAVVLEPFGAWCAQLSDRLFAAVARTVGKGYRPEHYPLGYLVEAKK
jgi:SAM-dependent methyltransferase